MRPLRVLHVTPYTADAWAYGGIPRVVGTLTRGLARRGHHVTVCGTDVCDETSRLGRDRADTVDRVTVRVFPNLSNTLAYRLQVYLPLGLDAYLKREAATFDVAHIHACRNLPGAIAAHRLRQAGVPYVLAPHGTAPIIERRRLTKRAFDIVLGRRVIAGASGVIALSNAEVRQLSALGIDPALIRVVPSPIDRREFDVMPRRGAFRQRHGLSNEPLVLFLGQLTPRKRLDVLVRAMARISDSSARLVIAGNDRGAERSARAAIRDLGLQDRTRFMGLLRAGERIEALNDADVVVYASEHEVFGLVPLEALLCGTPVIVAGDSGCGEVIRATGGGQVVSVGDADQLANAIDSVVASPEAWRAAAAQAAVRVREDYSEERVSAQIEDLYADCRRD